MIALITYELKQPDRDYSNLYNVIKNAGTSWWHYLESVWIINTTLTVDVLSSMVKSNLDEKDLLFVVDVTNCKYKGWLPSKAWQWCKTM